MMEITLPDTHALLAARIRQLRTGQGLTLDGLADRSGVSRSMISFIERGESSPTAAVLHRLAVGLGVSLASLFAEPDRSEAAPVARRADQISWRDPETGYLRRNLSPRGYPSPMELVEVVLPIGARVAYDTPLAPGAGGVSQQVWIIDGRIELTVGDVTHALETGDCLAMRVDRPTAFRNSGEVEARYVVALVPDLPAVNHARLNQEKSTS